MKSIKEQEGEKGLYNWGVCWCLGRIHSYIMFLARASTSEITAWSSCPLRVSSAHSTDASTVKCLKFFGPPVLSIGIKWFTVFLAGEPRLSFFKLHSWFDLFCCQSCWNYSCVWLMWIQGTHLQELWSWDFQRHLYSQHVLSCNQSCPSIQTFWILKHLNPLFSC